MTSFFAEIRQTLLPSLGSRDGPLPPLLVTLTFVTGLVDSFSYLVCGHVFVANMTGNVVFLGFALVGAPGFSIVASAAAIASFVAGALVGGTFARRFTSHRGRLLSSAAGIQVLLVGTSVILAGVSGTHVTAGFRYGLIVVLAIAMGLQNAAARQLAVPDLTTTVLTMTMTGIAADAALTGVSASKAGRRLTAIAAMFLGALVGAACVLHVRIVVPLGIALVALVFVAATTMRLGERDPAWVRA